MSAKALYEILEVAPTATLEEIKAAYRRLAMKWHPDRNPGNLAEAERRFKEIGYAYKTLSDPEERAEYDAAQASEQSQTRYSETHQQSHSYDSSREGADSVFFDQMLDLAFELSRRGYQLDQILKMLLALDCPESIARAVAKRFADLGASSHAQPNAQSKSTASSSSTKSRDDDGRVPRDITKVDWEVAAPYYEAYLGHPNDHYLKAFESYHNGYFLGSWEKFSFLRLLAYGYWFAYRKMTLPAIAFAIYIVFGAMTSNNPSSFTFWAYMVIGMGIGVWVAASGTQILYKAATDSINGLRGTWRSDALPRISAIGKPSHVAWIVMALLSLGIGIAGINAEWTQQSQATINARMDAAIATMEKQSPQLDPASPNYQEHDVVAILESQKRLVSQGIDPEEALWTAYNQYLERTGR